MLARLIATVLTGEIAFTAGQMRRRAIMIALAALMVAFGLCFLVGAAYLAAAARYGTVEAALLFGVGFLVIGMVFLIWDKLATRVDRRHAAERRASETKVLAGAAALAVLPSLISRGGIAALAIPAVLAAAYAVYRENSQGGHSAGGDAGEEPPDA